MDAEGAQPFALQCDRVRTDGHARAAQIGGDAVAQVHLGERAAAAVGRRFDLPRRELLAADFLSEGPQRLQRMLPRMRIDVREERALPLLLGREWLLGCETCPTGYHVGGGVRHQILARLDSGEEAGASP